MAMLGTPNIARPERVGTTIQPILVAKPYGVPIKGLESRSRLVLIPPPRRMRRLDVAGNMWCDKVA